MSDMPDANEIISHLKEHEVVSKRHHPPASRVTIRWIPLWKYGQRITGIEKSSDKMVGHLTISRLRTDEITNIRKIALTARRIDDCHKSPSCLRIDSLLMPSPR